MFIFELYKPFKDRNQEYQDSYFTIGTHHKDILSIFIQSLDHKQPFLLGVERNLCLGPDLLYMLTFTKNMVRCFYVCNCVKVGGILDKRDHEGVLENCVWDMQPKCKE